MDRDQVQDTANAYRRKMSKHCDDIKEVRDRGKEAKSNPAGIPIFKGMYSLILTSYDSFESNYDELCDLHDEDNEPMATAMDNLMRANARRYLFEAHTYMADFEAAEKDQTNRLSQSFSGQTKTKLPTLELPKFNGDRTKWPLWKDTFTSMVKDELALTDIDKFHYLIRSLEGKAMAVIAHVPVSQTNFNVAWDTLVETYDNKRLLASSYLDQLLEIKPLYSKASAEQLSKTVAKLSETVAAFKLLHMPDNSEFILFHLARRTLDTQTREEFERENKEDYPSFDSLIKFLRSKCIASELAIGLSRTTVAQDLSHRGSSYNHSRRSFRPSTSSKVALVGSGHSSSSPSKRYRDSRSTASLCFACHASHYLSNCLKFANMAVSDRFKLLKSFKGCRNCLALDHKVDRCHSTYRCRFCRGKHHSLLHQSNTATSSSPGPQPPDNPPSGPDPVRPHTDNATASSLNVTAKQQEIMLGTLVCHIFDSQGLPHQIRLVMDSGSHFTFITRSFAERIGLNITKTSTGIWGIGETPLGSSKGRAYCTLSPIDSDHPRLSTNAIVLDVITSPLPGFDSPPELWKDYHNYPLSDPEFWVTKPVDLLIGCDLFADIVTGDIITISKSLPRLLGTIFGYTVLGRVREVADAYTIHALLTSTPSPMNSLHEELRRFWDLEEPPVVKVQNPEDAKCEELFKTTHYRMPDGRYVVRLPFRDDKPYIANSRGMALRRQEHLESKLSKNSLIKEKYHEFMMEYHALGHMEIAKQPGKYLIPHHCVVKSLPDDDIKLRVVFDAAARTASGSLNDLLLVGPKLQPNLIIILLSFRIHPYVFTADAIKMFRQILIHPEDRVYQHILWRFDTSAAMQEYELNTVSYGQAPAPYLALRTVKQLVADEGHAYPLAAAALSDDTYIDDVATGADTLEEALELLRQLVELMAKGGFSLSKWASNHPSILQACHQADPEGTRPPEENVSLESTSEENQIKILGMQWDPQADVFAYKISPPLDISSKRAVLSAVAKIFDPLGYLGPTVVVAKILIQDAWKEQLNWDDEFPHHMKHRWSTFLEELPTLGEIKIPRWHVPVGSSTSILIFADASEKAYCAAAYLRTMAEQGPQMHLILAKTKLAPVKFTTIPRLELCAALLAARLWESLQPYVKKLPSQPNIHFFSDSMVVLSWLHTPFHLLKTFVANRVVQIRSLTTPGKWHHVSSSDNPSDLGSRGISALELKNSSFWFHGPSWALNEPTNWPLRVQSPMSQVPELKTTIKSGHALVTTSEESSFVKWISRWSNLNKLLRSLAYALRFINILRKKPSTNLDHITVSEIRNATTVAVKWVQSYYFFKNRIPTSDTPIPKNLISLSPFLDEAGILLVGGRLKNADVSWETQHPMLLPAKAYFTKLILKHYHKIHLHPGSSLLLAIVRSKFWIPGARNAVRELSKECITCRKFDAPTCQPIMGNLPAARFCDGFAFLHVGVDFAGPFTIRESSRRKACTSKSYLCLFVCLSTKALHLELVSALSTSAFLAALNRFIGRRGKPEKVFSDNGTNFVGAAHQLRQLYRWYGLKSTKDEILQFSTDKQIEWTFNPPHAPSFGGVWEAGVKSVKRLLRSVYGGAIFTFEELSTLFIEIEAILNSRPLCPISSDANDFGVLSPGHFLIGRQPTAIPRPSLIDTSENRLSRWELVEQKLQHFWKRWRREYLTSLQQRSKWQSSTRNIQVGDLVLLRDEVSPCKNWPVGRVTQLFPGNDGVVRVVNLRLSISPKQLRRPVCKLVLLLPNQEKDCDSVNN